MTTTTAAAPAPRTAHRTAPGAGTAESVADACRWIEARVADGPDGAVVLADVAAAVGTSADTLRRAFVRALGVTPRQYADTLRRERLRGELRTGTDVTGALFAAGYGSTSRLYESAHTHLGMTPASYRAGGAGATITWTVTPSDLGPLLVAATDRGLCFIQLGDDPATLESRLAEEFPAAILARDDVALGPIVDAVLQRIAGDPAPAAIPLDITGTAFQRRVWEALRHIPYGQVRTYGEIAEEIGSPRAVRAVGTACGANPVGLVIPCHRVVPKSGGVGNYGFGPERKRVLLGREGASVRNSAAGHEDHGAATLDLD
jgi:AraC family transcriptional regulator of adaptative response/methylated-DNA-[protein]-cysteine methyltransferase